MKNFTPLIAALALTAVIPAAARTDIITIIDGDTIMIGNTRIRLLDIDTPETFHSRCEAEIMLGLKAKQRLRQLLSSGSVTYTAHGFDRYGRVLARVYVNGRDVGAQLLAEGYALEWHPGVKAKASRLQYWCRAN